MKLCQAGLIAAAVCALAGWQASAVPGEFHFAILGDRTGEAQPGVYEAAWKAAVDEAPAFAINVGDTIQGGNDATAMSEWRQAEGIWRGTKHRFPLYLVPGNHDVWSDVSAHDFQLVAHHPLHYSFDYRQAHFTVLDNSRVDDLVPEELEFLKADLAAHQTQPLKFVLFHRPYWIFKVLLRDPEFPLHKIARQYGVQYVICGHLHEMLHFELDGVQYLSMASSGGHLRNPKTYDAGWFFGQTLVDVKGTEAAFSIRELGRPFGQGRTTDLRDWGAAGLKKH